MDAEGAPLDGGAQDPWEGANGGQAEALALASPLLLPYERQLIEEAIQDDSLIITAAGLGWQRLVAVLLRIAQRARMAEVQRAQEQQLQQLQRQRQQQQQQPAAAGTSGAGSATAGAPPGPTTSPPPPPGGTPAPAPAAAAASGAAPPSNCGCVLVLGAAPWQRALIAAELARHDPSLPPPLDITNEVPAAERLALYGGGAAPGRPLFITPRILVVDLLSRRVRAAQVAGLLLLNAHRATDTSGEGFAVALLRADQQAAAAAGPRWGGGGGGAGAAGGVGPARCWVRGVSDVPAAFNQGFNKVEKVMKALQVRRLHLWPRFQEQVRQCLDSHKPVVVEWEQELSGPMVLIQAALLEVLEGLIRELKRTNKNLDTSELVLEAGVLKSFDEIVRRQLDPIWHTVGWKTRRICTDLRTLRELSCLLLALDPVTFLAHLEGLRQSEGVRCVWLFHDATHAVFEQARRRVYVYRQRQADKPTGAAAAAAAAAGSGAGSAGGGSGGGGGCCSEVEAVLEEPPKWGLLVEVLREVQRQREQLRSLDPDRGDRGPAAAAGEAGSGGEQGEGQAAAAPQQQQQQQATAREVVELLDDSEEDSDGDVVEVEVEAAAAAGAGAGAGAAAGAGAGAGGRARPAAGGAKPARTGASTGADKGPQGGSGVDLAALLEELGLTDWGRAGVGAAGDTAAGGPQEEQEQEEEREGEQEEREGEEAEGTGGGMAGTDRAASCAGASTSAAGGSGGGGGNRCAAAAGKGGRAAGGVALSAEELRLLAAAGRAPVLVVARELHSARLLERVVRTGGRAVLQQLYESYLVSKLQGAGAAGGAGGGGGEDGAGAGGGGGGRGGRGGGRGGRGGRGGWRRGGRGGGRLEADLDDVGRGPVLRPGEAQALLAEAQRVGAERLGGGGAGAGRGGASAGGGKRAKTSHGAGGGRAEAGGARGRGRHGASRQRKPDDSPVRVAAAAAAGHEEQEDGGDVQQQQQQQQPQQPEEEELQAQAAGAGAGAGAAAGGPGGARGRGRGGSTRGRGRTAAAAAAGAAGKTAGRRRRRSGGEEEDADSEAAAAAEAEAGGAAAAAAPVAATAASLLQGGGTGAYGSEEQGAAGAIGGGPSTAAPTATATACPLLCDVHFVALDAHDEFVLWRLRPCVIIMFEPDLAFLRQVEVYQAERTAAGGPPLWLHSLCYAASLEAQRFRAGVGRERDTLLRLIAAKQHIVLPTPAAVGAAGGGGGAAVDVSGRGALNADLWLDVYSANALTRTAGGRSAAAAAAAVAAAAGGPAGASGGGGRGRLVVDVREFMSGLPAVLYRRGFELLPVTLEVGDYVLSPQLVVERKSLPDLAASLASGRLYHQAEVMCRHYARPLLLLEFDPDRQFGLQSPAELGDDIDPKNIISKLTLLTTHFPKLRLLWSRSPHATADLFAALKSNQDQPDAAAAALVGVPLGPDGAPLPIGAAAAGGGGGGGVGGGPPGQQLLEAVVNQPAMELLRRLPGVNDSNYRALLGQLPSLAALADTPLARLEAIMGSAKNARALREFLDAPCPRL